MRPIVVRGGGDLATGTVWMLREAGYPVLVTETERPMAIRREAAFCEAVRLGKKTVEGRTCRLVNDLKEALRMTEGEEIPLLVDPGLSLLSEYHPDVLVDAILAKKNLGTEKDMADLTIALGPGFTAGEDVDLVIETMRGHRLGRLIEEGSAIPNTGVPGLIEGYGKERVIHAPADGTLTRGLPIGSLVKEGETIAVIETGDGETEVLATLSGVLRGILPDDHPVRKGLKTADIDPRSTETGNCVTISDKARCIGGAVLLAVSRFEKSKGHDPR